MAPDVMNRSANDWSFKTEAEGNILLGGFGGLLRLFYFESARQKIGSYVLYAGLGVGLGIKVRATPQGVHAALEIADRAAKPRIKSGNVELALSRRKIPSFSWNIVKTEDWFSLAELDGARGKITSLGAGVGVGLGMLSAMAFNSEKVLFASEKIGGELGSLGISLGDSQDGEWRVLYAWDESILGGMPW